MFYKKKPILKTDVLIKTTSTAQFRTVLNKNKIWKLFSSAIMRETITKRQILQNDIFENQFIFL